jgi:hypothetical protein
MNTIIQTHDNICVIIDKELSKDFLLKNWFPPAVNLLKTHEAELRKNGYGPIMPANLNNIPVRIKSDVVVVVAILFSGSLPYRLFRESLPEDVLMLWDALVKHNFIGFAEAKLTLGIEVVDKIPPKSSFYMKEPEVKEKFNIFPSKSPFWAYQQLDSYFWLPRLLRETLISLYEIPASAKLLPAKDLPEEGIFFSDTESQFFSDYGRMNLYYKQDEISYSTKLRPVQTGLGKIQRTLKIREFFPDTTVKQYKYLKTNMLASVMPYFFMVEKNLVEPQDILKAFIRKAYGNGFPSATVLLPDIKGLAYFENHQFKVYEGQMLKLLKDLPQNEYVAIENILGYCSFSLFQTDIVGRNEAYEKLTMEAPEDGHYKVAIGYNRHRNAIELPVLKGTFFFFAALGLCEIIYDEVDEYESTTIRYSPWDNLIAVKRTALGDYVCGLSEQYQMSESKIDDFTLSDSALIIKLDSAESPYSVSFSNFAEQLNPLSFKTDASIFLKNVRSLQDLNTKIALFKQMVPTGMPKNWQDFFNGLFKKVDPMDLYGDCAVFRIPSDNKAFIQILAQDTVIKKLVFKAEGYLIIVPKSNIPPLKRRLAEFGYLLT